MLDHTKLYSEEIGPPLYSPGTRAYFVPRPNRGCGPSGLRPGSTCRSHTRCMGYCQGKVDGGAGHFTHCIHCGEELTPSNGLAGSAIEAARAGLSGVVLPSAGTFFFHALTGTDRRNNGAAGDLAYYLHPTKRSCPGRRYGRPHTASSVTLTCGEGLHDRCMSCTPPTGIKVAIGMTGLHPLFTHCYKCGRELDTDGKSGVKLVEVERRARASSSAAPSSKPVLAGPVKPPFSKPSGLWCRNCQVEPSMVNVRPYTAGSSIMIHTAGCYAILKPKGAK